jgi:succinate-semialdehyde dehydrogenase/glutarate-semialdehyde dehydrogenase
MAIVKPIETPSGARRRLGLASPATLEPIGEIEVQTPEEVAAAAARAREVQPAWGALPVKERARYLLRALDTLVERQDEFIDVIVRESGKPRMEAILIDIFAACDALRFYARRAPKMLSPEWKRLHGLLALAKRCRIVYRPLGVVGVISPWNGPLILALNPAIQALVAGNAVIVKPSEVTPFSGGLLAHIFEGVGLPEGLLTVLSGDGETGAALVEAGVDKISFTGSVATGRKVAEACARRLIPCTLELGGKDPLIVCADANVDRAAGGAVAGAFFNTGQVCFSTERVYAVDAVAEEFIRKVVERTAALRQQSTGEFDVGAVCWPRQLEIIEEHMADAIEKGARVRTGGRRNPNLDGLYWQPTVLTEVTHDMRIMREETFGPILPIMRVRDEDEAVRLANDSSYGLSASVWTRDPRKGLEIAQRLDAGSVCVNDRAMTYGVQEAPFGGRKESGIGHVNGEVGLRGYCYPQPILIDRFGGRQAAENYPYARDKDATMQKLIRFLWGTRVGRWIS